MFTLLFALHLPAQPEQAIFRRREALARQVLEMRLTGRLRAQAEIRFLLAVAMVRIILPLQAVQVYEAQGRAVVQ
jgi:hypothetical protein